MNRTLVAVHVGKPRVYREEKPWTTAIFKSRVEGPVMLRSENLDGDAQADRRVHGGPDKAVCVYAASHYALWRGEPEYEEMGPGGFGENFTIDHCSDESVSIGDVYEVGDSVVEVSQPRGPCSKLARRWNSPDFVKRVIGNGRTGWYLRVLNEGLVRAGDAVLLLERPHPEWTIAAVNQLTYDPQPEQRQQAMRLVECPELAESWRSGLARRLR